MEYRQLGRSDLKLSLIGLGTMTFGEQNTEAEAHAQMDYALERGVNFIDAAEMYPVPPRAQTQGRTEQYVGSWLKQGGRRQDVVLATKAAGPADVRGVNHVRGGRTRLNLACLEEALNDSLRRLQTDYVDLYQLHWPDRSTNRFGQLGYRHVDDEQPVPIEETAAALTALVRSGKARYVGVSNETPWGLAQYLEAADRGLTRIVSIQNPYSLLNRSFEVGLAEFAVREQVSLIAYSPLAFGTLSGKFLDGARPPAARVTRWARFSRYSGDAAQRATVEYVAVARRHGLDPAQMAIAFVMAQRFVASTLIGATTMEQLKTNLASEALRLPAEVLDELEQVQRRNPNPCS
jgi:aryl-alcohol dehydrogenase-like predicted oxidoreductase